MHYKNVVLLLGIIITSTMFFSIGISGVRAWHGSILYDFNSNEIGSSPSGSTLKIYESIENGYVKVNDIVGRRCVEINHTEMGSGRVYPHSHIDCQDLQLLQKFRFFALQPMHKSFPVTIKKGEKNRGDRSEIDPETVCVQAVEAPLWGDCVPFV